VHPFCFQWFANGVAKYKSFVVISDDLKHIASGFHGMRSYVIEKIKRDLDMPEIEKIYYISDGNVNFIL
jgi:hypothetical protein